MPIGILFWVLFVIWVIFGGLWLGWHDFGFILQGR